MAQTHYASAYGRTIAIESSEIDLVLPFLPFPWMPEAPSVEIDRRYRVSTLGEDRFGLSIDGAEPNERTGLGQIGDDIEGDLHHWLATYTRGYLFVHAGSVSWRNRAIVIPGRSHAGKTTLTRALVEAGATYYSDDYAVVAPDGLIWPFPRRLHVRPITAGPPHRLDPVGANWLIGTAPIRAVLVAEVKFDPESGWDIERLTHGMGALSLLDNTVAARERPEDSLRMMANVMDSAIAIKGTRDDAESSARRLLALVDEVLGG